MNLKLKTIILLTTFIFLLVECKVKKAAPLKMIPFNYPDDIVEAAKPGFVKDYNKGHLIYNMECAKCHNKTIDGQSVIPDFSLPQLMDYEIRIQYPDHQEPMRETNLSGEELELVILFLRYRERVRSQF